MGWFGLIFGDGALGCARVREGAPGGARWGAGEGGVGLIVVRCGALWCAGWVGFAVMGEGVVRK